MKINHLLAGVLGSTLFALGLPMTAAAAATVTVTPSNTQGWSTADTTAGGAVNFIEDTTAPAGAGALQLTTDATTAAKAQYMHAANTPLADVTELSYYTKQNSATFAEGEASYQLAVNLLGTSGFSTLVFEPYYNTAQGAAVPNTWQQWDVDSGLFWSSKTITCPNGVVAGTSGGPAAYTLAQIEALCPAATVTGFGVNVGSFNPGYDVETDLVDFNGTVYDFEPAITPTDKDACKNGGWQSFNSPTFKNQGECVSFVASHGKAKGNPTNPVQTVMNFFSNLL
jgi:hypothetical protein